MSRPASAFDRDTPSSEPHPWTVTWRLPDVDWATGQSQFTREFTISGAFPAREDAAERLFLVANGMDHESDDGVRWEQLRHRSMTAGDHVAVNGEQLYCDSFGWRELREGDPMSMEQKLGMPFHPPRYVASAYDGQEG